MICTTDSIQKLWLSSIKHSLKDFANEYYKGLNDFYYNINYE